MIKIIAFTRYSYEGPSSRYRFYNYIDCFRKNDIEFVLKPLFTSFYFKASNKIFKFLAVMIVYLYRFFLLLEVFFFNKKYTLVLIEYELFPYLPAWFEWLLYKRGVKYIVDYDDAIFHKYDKNHNVIIRKLLKNKIAKVMRYADTVIVCNEYLESYAKKYNSHTFRLPTVVLLDKYKEKMKTYQQNESGDFVIGWIGSGTTSIYILEILPAIKKFVDTYKNVRFDLVGFDSSLLSPEKLKNYHIKIIKWKEETEIENILTFDVGIMPLHDDPWSRGKCGFKLVQYMSCKKPVIASPVGMNCTLVQNEKNGFLVQTEDAWFNAFEALYQDEHIREKMATNNFLKIETEYNYEKNCEKYVKFLKNIVKE